MHKQKLDLTLELEDEELEWMDNKIALKEFQNRNEVVEHAIRLFMEAGETRTFDREV